MGARGCLRLSVVDVAAAEKDAPAALSGGSA